MQSKWLRERKKSENSQEQDNREFFLALDMLEKERGIKKEYMLEKISQALATAYKRDHEGVGDNIAVIADEEHNIVRMVIRRDVVEEVDNPYTEISLEDARRSLPHVGLGDVVSSEIRTKNFGRIAAQTARQVIIQGIREAERSKVYDAFTEKTAELHHRRGQPDRRSHRRAVCEADGQWRDHRGHARRR